MTCPRALCFAGTSWNAEEPAGGNVSNILCPGYAAAKQGCGRFLPGQEIFKHHRMDGMRDFGIPHYLVEFDFTHLDLGPRTLSDRCLEKCVVRVATCLCLANPWQATNSAPGASNHLVRRQALCFYSVQRFKSYANRRARSRGDVIVFDCA